MREAIIKNMHENPSQGGHMGVHKILEKLKLRFYWPKMAEDVQNLLRSCKSCQLNKEQIHPNHEELYPIEKSASPFEHLHMDIIGPVVPSTRGSKYILSIIDGFSKYLLCFPMRDQTAITVTRILINHVISKYGVPKFITSDQGRNFMSQILKDISDIFGFQQLFSVAYHQAANGQIERANRVVKTILSNYVDNDGRNWEDYLQLATMCYNSSVNETTKFSPFFINHGREMSLPIDRILKISLNPEEDCTLFKESFSKKMAEIWQMTKANIEEAQKKQKENFDIKTNPANFEINDLVLKKVEVPDHKFSNKFEGPYRVIGIQSPNIILKDEQNAKILETHMNKVKKFYENMALPMRFNKRYADPNIESEAED